MTYCLTPNQSELLEVIKSYISSHGYAPTVQELCNLTGRASKGSMFRQLEILESKGAIKKKRGARGISVTGKCPYCGGSV